MQGLDKETAWGIGFTKYANRPRVLAFIGGRHWISRAMQTKASWSLVRAFYTMHSVTFQEAETVEQSLTQARMETESREVLSSDRGC